MRRFKSLSVPAMVVSIVALTVALGGTATGGSQSRSEPGAGAATHERGVGAYRKGPVKLNGSDVEVLRVPLTPGRYALLARTVLVNADEGLTSGAVDAAARCRLTWPDAGDKEDTVASRWTAIQTGFGPTRAATPSVHQTSILRFHKSPRTEVVLKCRRTNPVNVDATESRMMAIPVP